MTQIPEDLQKKLVQLREEYEGDENQDEISKREKVLIDRLKASGLASVEGVKEIIQDARRRVHNLNISLAYDDELSEIERARLIERRNFFETYILRRFGAYKTKDAIADLEKYVDEKLAL